MLNRGGHCILRVAWGGKPAGGRPVWWRAGRWGLWFLIGAAGQKCWWRIWSLQVAAALEDHTRGSEGSAESGKSHSRERKDNPDTDMTAPWVENEPATFPLKCRVSSPVTAPRSKRDLWQLENEKMFSLQQIEADRRSLAVIILLLGDAALSGCKYSIHLLHLPPLLPSPTESYLYSSMQP